MLSRAKASNTPARCNATVTPSSFSSNGCLSSRSHPRKCRHDHLPSESDPRHFGLLEVTVAVRHLASVLQERRKDANDATSQEWILRRLNSAWTNWGSQSLRSSADRRNTSPSLWSMKSCAGRDQSRRPCFRWIKAVLKQSRGQMEAPSFDHPGSDRCSA